VKVFAFPQQVRNLVPVALRLKNPSPISALWIALQRQRVLSSAHQASILWDMTSEMHPAQVHARGAVSHGLRSWG